MKKLLVVLSVFALAVSPVFANCGNDNGNGNGCSGNQGPQGPAGPTGPQGPAGSDGANGTNGANGADGQNGKNGVDGKDGKAPAGLTDSKLLVDTAIRLYDGKRLQLQAFNAYALGRHHNQDLIGNGHNFIYGVRVVFKLGKSHEERILEQQQREIDALKKLLSQRVSR